MASSIHPPRSPYPGEALRAAVQSYTVHERVPFGACACNPHEKPGGTELANEGTRTVHGEQQQKQFLLVGRQTCPEEVSRNGRTAGRGSPVGPGAPHQRSDGLTKDRKSQHFKSGSQGHGWLCKGGWVLPGEWPVDRAGEQVGVRVGAQWVGWLVGRWAFRRIQQLLLKFWLGAWRPTQHALINCSRGAHMRASAVV